MHQPPNIRRRRVLAIAGGGVAALGAGAAVVKAVSGPRSASGTGSGTGSAPYDPGTLPTAAGNGAGITPTDTNALLGQLNDALARRDKASFTARYAAGPVADQAATMFANIGKFAFDKLEYQFIGQGGRMFDAGNGADVKVDVALVHQIAGIDAVPLPEWYRWTLSRPGHGGPVTITAVTGSPTVGGSAKYVYYPAIWDSPHDITVIKRPHLYLTAETAAEGAVLERHAAGAAQAIASNRAGWKQGGGRAGIAPGALVVGTSSRNKFYYWYSGKANQYGNESGLAIPVMSAASMDSQQANLAIGGARIVLDLTSQSFTASAGEDTPQTLIQHEDAHNMVFSIMTAQEYTVPTWVIEGFADFMATRSYSHPVRNYFRLPGVRAYTTTGADGSTWDKTLPTNDQVYSIDGAQASACYGLSALAYYYIQQRMGMRGVVSFLTANYAVPASTDGVMPTDSVDSAISKATGMDLTEFQQDWVAYVRKAVSA